MAALVALLLAMPVFRVGGDYLAIVTLGFGEVVQVVANNLVNVTNGSGPQRSCATHEFGGVGARALSRSCARCAW